MSGWQVGWLRGWVNWSGGCGAAWAVWCLVVAVVAAAGGGQVVVVVVVVGWGVVMVVVGSPLMVRATPPTKSSNLKSPFRNACPT